MNQKNTPLNNQSKSFTKQCLLFVLKLKYVLFYSVSFFCACSIKLISHTDGLYFQSEHLLVYVYGENKYFNTMFTQHWEDNTLEHNDRQ